MISDKDAGPRTLLIVEDNLLVAMELQALVEELGYAVGGRAGTVAGALRLLDGADCAFDAAVLDVNLGAETAFPIADRLEALGVPFVFATGYDALERTAPPRHRKRICIAKPYARRDLRQALKEIED